MGRMTEILADYVLAFDLDKTRPADRAGALAALRDCFGCMLAGVSQDAPAVLRRYAAGLESRATATVLGVRGLRTDAGTAAMVNGTAAHIHDYDDVSTNVTGHPSVVVLPTALAVGEETGALPEMLIRVANTYDDEVDNAVAAMTSVIEPIMIIFLAVVVGGIVVAMLMPLISIIGTIGGGAGA